VLKNNFLLVLKTDFSGNRDCYYFFQDRYPEKKTIKHSHIYIYCSALAQAGQ